MAVDEVLYDVELRQESRGMWKVYLGLQVGQGSRLG